MPDPHSSISNDFHFSSDSESSVSFEAPFRFKKKHVHSNYVFSLRTRPDQIFQEPGSHSSDGFSTRRHLETLRFKRSLSSISGLPSPGLLDNEHTSNLELYTNKRDVSAALPTPPESEDEDLDGPLINATPQISQDSFPFPLQPAKLPSVGENKAPQTPSRRRRSPQRFRYRASPSPDRFISNRSTPTTPQNPAETYRVSRLPQQLLPNERLLRHNLATPDPFGPLRVARVRNERSNSHRGRGSPPASRSPSRTVGATNVSDLASDRSVAQNRQVSPIWNVGGAAQTSLHEPMRGVSNGRGGLIRSGSNAPMYDSHFLDDLSTDQDIDQMERRLAAAFDLDQTRRVLTNSRSPETSRNASTGSIGIKRKRLCLEAGSTWQETSWTQDVLTDRRSLFYTG